jgi:hypothetical protein
MCCLPFNFIRKTLKVFYGMKLLGVTFSKKIAMEWMLGFMLL